MVEPFDIELARIPEMKTEHLFLNYAEPDCGSEYRERKKWPRKKTHIGIYAGAVRQLAVLP